MSDQADTTQMAVHQSAVPQQHTASSVSTNHGSPAFSLRQKLTSGLNQWKAFWFEPSDPLMLAIIRILTAGMLFYNLCVWTLDFEAFFSANGLQPLATVQKIYEGSPVFSFWFYVPEPWLWIAHLSCLAIVFLFFTGTATRLTSILSYLITISYSQRVPIANFGLDQILGLLCLYLAVGPCGACLSVDSWIRKLKARRKQTTESAVEAVTKLKSSSATVSLRLIQIHLCVIYFWAGFAKLKGDSWFTGEAMWNVIANLEYQTTDLTWMAHVPWLPYLVAHITVIWELFFCVLVWNKTVRPVVLLIGTGMHFGIGAFLGMWTFGLAMTFCYFAFSDAATVRSRWSRWFWRTEFGKVHVEQPVRTSVSAPPPVNAAPLQTSAIADSTAAAPLPASASTVAKPKNSDSIRGLPGTELLVIALRERHRQSLQKYFRNHNVPCRSTAHVQASELLAADLPPAAILIMASELSLHQLTRLIDDLENVAAVPILVVVSEALMQEMQHREQVATLLQAPVTLKEIHEELIQAIWKGRDGFQTNLSAPNSTDQ